MNCQQASKISIEKVLESFSLFPSKMNSKTAFYYAIDRDEKTPSLHVDFARNSAFDFGTGKKYDNVSLVQTIKRCTVSEALEYLQEFDVSFQSNDCFTKEKSYSILGTQEVKHPALLTYLNSRKVFAQKDLLQEVHYMMNGTNYFALGFKNDSGGFEIRNPYVKICLGKKDLTTIKNGSSTLRIFEGFFDFLSFESIREILQKPKADSIILNSVSMVFKVKDQIQDYQNMELYFDNDDAGNRATKTLESCSKYGRITVEDCRNLYQDFKDLNEFLTSKK